MRITVLDRQSLFDIAVLALGSAAAAFELALANDLSLTDDLEVGAPLNPSSSGNLAETLSIKAIADYYANKQLKPATGITDNYLLGRIFDYTFDESFN